MRSLGAGGRGHNARGFDQPVVSGDHHASTDDGAPPTTTPEYIVQDGDSLSIIAQRFGVSTEDLANFNGIENANDIKVGQTLTIPPTTTPPTSADE